MYNEFRIASFIICQDEDEPSIKKTKLTKKTSSTKLKAKVAKAGPSPKPSGKRVKCNYWDKCYRKDANHRKQFFHPGDTIPDDDGEC